MKVLDKMQNIKALILQTRIMEMLNYIAYLKSDFKYVTSA